MKYLIICLCALLNACAMESPKNTKNMAKDHFAHIEDEMAKEIIKRSIAFSGGLDQWKAIKSLRYTKNFELFGPDQSVEKSYNQIHSYQYNPTIINIFSIENQDTVITKLENNTYTRTINGGLTTTNQESLEKAINTSTYVVGIPFKLIDPGVQIQYLGKDTIFNDQIADVIEFTYNADENSNHSTSDTWRYYFDQENAKVIANWVQSSDHANIIENWSFTRVNGILFNQRRKSYRLDSIGNKTHLRADYLYENYELE